VSGGRVGLEGDEDDDGLAGGVVLGADHGRLGDARMIDQRGLTRVAPRATGRWSA